MKRDGQTSHLSSLLNNMVQGASGESLLSFTRKYPIGDAQLFQVLQLLGFSFTQRLEINYNLRWDASRQGAVASY